MDNLKIKIDSLKKIEKELGDVRKELANTKKEVRSTCRHNETRGIPWNACKRKRGLSSIYLSKRLRFLVGTRRRKSGTRWMPIGTM